MRIMRGTFGETPVIGFVLGVYRTMTIAQRPEARGLGGPTVCRSTDYWRSLRRALDLRMVELWTVYSRPADRAHACEVRKVLVEDDGLKQSDRQLFRHVNEARSVLARRGLI